MKTIVVFADRAVKVEEGTVERLTSPPVEVELRDGRLRVEHLGTYEYTPSPPHAIGFVCIDPPAEPIYSWGTHPGPDGYLLGSSPAIRHPRVPDSGEAHYLEPGQAWLWDFDERYAKVPDLTAARSRHGRPSIGEPRIERARALWTGSAASLSWETPAPRRDVGWWMWWYHQRHQYGAKPRWDGYYYLGGCPGPEGQTNWHYDGVWHFFRNWLATGDPVAWAMAYMTARHVACAGMVGGRQRYEKGSRVGDFLPPQPSHQWSRGLRAVAEASQDPFLMRRVAEVDRWLVGAPIPWQGFWGSRQLAWTLRERRLAGLVSEWIPEALNYWRTDHFENRGYSGVYAGCYDPWQDAILLTQLAAVGAPAPPEWVTSFLDRHLRIVERGYVRAAYRAHPTIPAEPQWEWGHPSLTAWYLPLLKGLGHPLYEPARRTVVDFLGANWQDIDRLASLDPGVTIGVDSHAYGAGAMKLWSSQLLAMEDL